MTRVAINGFGRIGRNFLRAWLDNSAGFEIVAVNDIGELPTMAHLLQYDSTLGRLPDEVAVGPGVIRVGGHELRALTIAEPERLPWRELGIDVVVESTGRFTKREKAEAHLHAGAASVLISAVAEDADAMIVMGVNDAALDPDRHRIISNASCTTNCLVPMVKVVRDNFGFVRGSMVTVHSYTNDQNILDLPHKDLRRARAAAISMIPTTTGAAKATSLVIPELKGKIDGMSIRVPTPDVSFTDLTAVVDKTVTIEQINDAFRTAADGELKGILKFTDLELVSSDYIGNPHSCIIDGKCTNVVDGTLVKVSGWYDNEWGYASRCVDLLRYVGGKL